jgi:probable O-glycosylation ligase (exosortase A-associated)
MNPDIVLNHEVRTYIQGGSFLGDGNDFGLSLCILFPMSIELALGARSRFRAGLAWAALGVFLLAIIGTQSRGATLGLAAVLAFLWLLSKRKAASLVGLLLVFAIVAMVASQEYLSRMDTIKSYQTEESAAGRIMAWKAGVHMALDNPLLGVSAGHFSVAFGTKYKPKDVGPIAWLTAHSMYFLVLGELGFPGIVAYGALVFGGMASTMAARRRLLMSSAKDPPPDDIAQSARLLYLLTASVLGFAVAGAFLSVTYYPHVFVLSGILLAARQVTESLSNAAGISDLARGRSGVHGLRQRTVRKQQGRGTRV